MNEIATRDYEALDMVDDPQERLNIGWLASVCRDIAAAPRRVDAIKAAVAAHPTRLAYGTLKNDFYAFQKQGVAGLIDKRKLKKYGNTNTWAECFMWYCENHNRSNKGAWKDMMDDFWAGKSLPHGVGDWREAWRKEYPHRSVPDVLPEGWFPRCARYETLQPAIRKNPDYLFNIASNRKGRKEAQKYLLPVLTTRVGLEPGQVFEYDDVTVDCEIVMPGIGQIARPQMFVGYDIASGYKVVDVVRPQYPNEKGERRNSLKEREFRMLHAYELTGVGIHPSGSRHIVERGTTAVREKLEKRIKSIPVYGDLITYDRSGILAEAVHPGLFKGDGGGNFRLKGYCEQAHRGDHSRRAMLPGQVGQDADHRPESHAAMVRYDEIMMNLVKKLPEDKRELIMYNLCDWPTFRQLNALLTDKIMDDRNHRMEGWDDRRVVLWRLSDTDEWHTADELNDMAGEKRDAILAWISTHPECRSSGRMTRREVWKQGLSKLIRVPLYELPMMLDARLIKDGGDARLVTVRKNGIFGFTDQFYYGQDEVLFYATCKTRSGFQAALQPEREYLFFGTPYHQEAGVIVDKESGNVIGLAPAYKRAPLYDRDAIIRSAGKQNEDLARKLMPIRGRHQEEAKARLMLIGHNYDVQNGRTVEAVVSAEADDDVPDAMDRAASDFSREPVEIEG